MAGYLVAGCLVADYLAAGFLVAGCLVAGCLVAGYLVAGYFPGSSTNPTLQFARLAELDSVVLGSMPPAVLRRLDFSGAEANHSDELAEPDC